jgi:hypothetical protein
MEPLDEKRKLMLEAMKNLSEKSKQEKQQRFIDRAAIDREGSKNLAKGALDKESFKVKGYDAPIEESTVVRGANPKIKGPEAQKITSGKEFAQRQLDLDLKQRLKSSFKAAAEAGDKDMMAKLRAIAQKVGKGAKTGLKMLPVVGGVAAAAMSDDAAAGVPLLGDAEAAGMSAGDENQMMAEIQARKDYDDSQAARDKRAKSMALAKLAKLQG